VKTIHLTGNLNVDVLLGKLGEWPQPGTETLLESYELRVGGSFGNMALALEALNANVRYISSVGDDNFGHWLEEQLGAAGEQLHSVPGSTALTVGITHLDNQRTFFTHEGHFAQLPVTAIRDSLAQASPGDIFFMGGYFLLPTLREAAGELLSLARERGVRTGLDTGWPTEGWTEEVKAEVTALLPLLDYFIPNEEETVELLGKPATGLRELLELLREFDRWEDLTVIAKLGEYGAALRRAGKTVHLPGSSVDVVDTVGAGDSFDSGFLTALQRGLSVEEAVGIGNRVAAIAVSSNPRRYPGWAEVATSLNVT